MSLRVKAVRERRQQQQQSVLSSASPSSTIWKRELRIRIGAAVVASLTPLFPPGSVVVLLTGSSANDADSGHDHNDIHDSLAAGNPPPEDGVYLLTDNVVHVCWNGYCFAVGNTFIGVEKARKPIIDIRFSSTLDEQHNAEADAQEKKAAAQTAWKKWLRTLYEYEPYLPTYQLEQFLKLRARQYLGEKTTATLWAELFQDDQKESLTDEEILRQEDQFQGQMREKGILPSPEGKWPGDINPDRPIDKEAAVQFAMRRNVLHLIALSLDLHAERERTPGTVNPVVERFLHMTEIPSSRDKPPSIFAVLASKFQKLIGKDGGNKDSKNPPPRRGAFERSRRRGSNDRSTVKAVRRRSTSRSRE